MADFRIPVGGHRSIFIRQPDAWDSLTASWPGSCWSGLSLMRRFIAARSKRYSGDPSLDARRLAFYLAGKHQTVFSGHGALCRDGRYHADAEMQQRSLRTSRSSILGREACGRGAPCALSRDKGKWSAAGPKNAGSRLLDIINVARWYLVVVVVPVALENLGVNIRRCSPDRVGGVAVALRFRSVLGDCRFDLDCMDKPFGVGDSLKHRTRTPVSVFRAHRLKTHAVRSDNGEQNNHVRMPIYESGCEIMAA